MTLNDRRIETPEERRARVRQAYGLADTSEPEAPKPEAPAPKVEEKPAPTVPWFSSDPRELRAAANAQAQALGIDGVEDAELLDLSRRSWPDEASYWRRVGEVLARRERKASKAEAIGVGAVVSEAATGPKEPSAEDATRELGEIQAGKRGSPTSVANTKRRAQLRKQLREALSGR